MQEENNLDIEKTVLCSLVTSPKSQRIIFNKIKSKYFANIVHREIFNTALEIYNNGTSPDNVLIYQECKKFKKEIYNLLIDFMTNVFVLSPLVEQYCDSLFNNYINTAIKNAKTLNEHAIVTSEQNEYKSKDVNIQHISFGVEHFEENRVKRAESRILTGYNNFDDITGGFAGGESIVLAARPSVGKSAFALNIANNICIQDKHVLISSLEMPFFALQNKFVCMNAELPAKKFRSNTFTLLELSKYKEYLDSLKDFKLNVTTDYGLTTERLRIYAEKLKEKGELDFLIIDYIGLLNEESKTSNTPNVKISNFSREIKKIATTLDIPVLVLAQLSRELLHRENKRPELGDLRDSGAIEQDADCVIFLHRECMFKPDFPENDLEVIIKKARYGETNKVIRFDFNLGTQVIREKSKWTNFVA